MKFHVRDDFFNQEMQSFLTIGETMPTFNKEKSKYESNGIQESSLRLALKVYLKNYYFLYVSEGKKG